MPLNRSDLAAACRHNDDSAGNAGGIPALLMRLSVEPPAAIYVAEQRALRVALIASGVDPRLMAQATPRMLHKRQRDLIPVYAGVWLDGLAAGLQANYTAISQ